MSVPTIITGFVFSDGGSFPPKTQNSISTQDPTKHPETFKTQYLVFLNLKSHAEIANHYLSKNIRSDRSPKSPNSHEMKSVKIENPVRVIVNHATLLVKNADSEQVLIW